MFLTKLNLDPFDRNAWRLTRNAHYLHSALCAACSGSRQDAHLLHRVVQESGRHCIYLYSDAAPDARALPTGLYPAATRDITPWLDTFEKGDRLSFDIVAVPSKKVTNEYSHNSRRVVLRDSLARQAWLERKCMIGGCRIVQIHEGSEYETFVRKSREHEGFHLLGFHYSGLLEVTDPAAFRTLLATGIGSEKAYGYGMLMVAANA